MTKRHVCRHAGRDGYLLRCQKCEGLFGYGNFMVGCGMNWPGGLAVGWQLAVVVERANVGGSCGGVVAFSGSLGAFV